MTPVPASPSGERTEMQPFEPRSTLTCPRCGHQSTDLMPVDSCQFLYDCPACMAVLRPLPGDCCVYCSYGDVKCPPVQQGGGCCS